MTRLVVVLAALAMVGCASTPEPRIVTRTEYVPVPCEVPRIVRPAWAVDGVPLGAPIDVQMRALRADRKAALGHIRVLESAVDACREPSPAP